MEQRIRGWLLRRLSHRRRDRRALLGFLVSLLHIELKRPALPYFFFEVAGEPVAWERVKQGRFGAYVPEKTRQAEKAIGWAARAMGVKCDDISLFSVRLKFLCAGARKDCDNLEKTVLDGLQKVIWKNDNQVREVYKVITQNHRPRTEILIYQINEDYLAKCGESE